MSQREPTVLYPTTHPAAGPTLARVARELLDEHGLSPATRASYESVLARLVAVNGGVPVAAVTRLLLAHHLDEISHLGPGTHRRHRATIHRLFAFAAERGYVGHNAAAGLRPRRPDPARGEHIGDGEVRYLRPPQLDAMEIATLRRPRLRALVTLLHESGARVGEVLALNAADLDRTGHRFAVVGKGNKRRWCYFGGRAEAALRAYLDGHRHHPHPALFTEREARLQRVRRLSYGSAYRDWRAAVGGHPALAGARLHDLRHTFATERAGLVPLEVLRALLGHANIQTTLVYQKVTSDLARDVAQAALLTLADTRGHRR